MVGSGNTGLVLVGCCLADSLDSNSGTSSWVVLLSSSTVSSTEPNLQVFCCRPVTNLVYQQCKDRGARLWADGLFSAVAEVEVLITKLLLVLKLVNVVAQ